MRQIGRGIVRTVLVFISIFISIFIPLASYSQTGPVVLETADISDMPVQYNTGQSEFSGNADDPIKKTSPPLKMLNRMQLILQQQLRQQLRQQQQEIQHPVKPLVCRRAVQLPWLLKTQKLQARQPMGYL